MDNLVGVLCDTNGSVNNISEFNVTKGDVNETVDGGNRQVFEF